MKKYTCIGAIALALGVVTTAGAANASSLTVTDSMTLANPNAFYPLLGPGVSVKGANNAPVVIGGYQGVGGTVIGNGTSNPYGIQASNYYNPNANTPPLGWNPYGSDSSPSEWISIGGSLGNSGLGGGADLVFSFTSPEHSLDFLWGSPSVSNMVKLYSGADGTGSLVGMGMLEGTVSATGQSTLMIMDDTGTRSLETIYLSNYTGPGSFVDIASTVAFQSAVFSTAAGAGGFEIGDVRVSAVPLPMALALFGSAIAVLGIWGRLGRQTIAA